MNFARAFTAIIMTICLAIVGVAASGCVVDTAESDDVSLLPSVAEAAIKAKQAMDDAATRTNQGPMGTLTVHSNRAHFYRLASAFSVKDESGHTVAIRQVSRCPSSSCILVLPVGAYTIHFWYVDTYKTPDDAELQLGEEGATVTGIYDRWDCVVINGEVHGGGCRWDPPR